MKWTTEQLRSLKTLLTTDPRCSGLDDVAVAELLASKIGQAPRDSLDAGQLMSCLVEDEYNGLNVRGKTYWNMLLTAGTIPITPIVKQTLQGMFDVNSETLKNLKKMFKREGSLAEELGLPIPTPSNVADARRI